MPEDRFMPLPDHDLMDQSATPQPPSSRGAVWRLVRITLGLLLLLGGIAGLVLPVLQGWLMIFAALAILRKDLPWAAYAWDHWVVPLRAWFQHRTAPVRHRFHSWLKWWRGSARTNKDIGPSGTPSRPE